MKQETKKSFWKRIGEKLIEPEDSNLFGQIFIIIGGFLIVKWVGTIIPPFNGKEWLFFAFGFLFILWGVRLIRKS